MATFFRFWTRQAEARPFATIAVTEACLSTCGDLIAQTIGKHISEADEQKSYDFWRTSRFVLFATCLSPIGVRWHRFLDSRFPIRSQNTWFKTKRRQPGTSHSVASINARINARARRKSEQKHTAKQVGKRLLCDLLLYEPAMYIVFFGSMAVMEGSGLEGAKYRISTLMLPTYLTGLTISPIIQTVNFAFVPLVYRVPFGSCFDLFWDSYLSWVNNEKLASIEGESTGDLHH
ncbi:hypothetical protein GGI25_001442 [Coemansia spiralis]|uniref:Uncharacterized protein n=1 Tax=Coemansia spiralis TaxID=417178 RepID=A0A9W8KYF9_9FUNG|nr:hypothetical protein BX070DRAFT_232118 [Coemansia spiralis]KAJ2624515.1 hypothetical protein GGI26_001434 [Coemansia sp. RSA 1358]KAJ2679519.1 hypothetical protein GGI25_001442 [Coemansia spiralis]